MAKWRTKFLDFDARREPKTDRYCIKCQKDMAPDQVCRMVHIVDGGAMVLHPDDEEAYLAAGRALPGGQHPGDCGCHPIGGDCARKLGLDWTHAA